MQLTKTFHPDQFADALESWAWIGVEGKVPLMTSLFGHVFLQDGAGCWYLNVISGSLEQCWADVAELQTVLDSEAGQDEFLLGGLALAADRHGVQLDDHQVYDFTPPPALGGPFDVANISAADFVVTVNVLGQIHDQVRALRPGTKISRVTMEEPTPSKPGRFWRRG